MVNKAGIAENICYMSSVHVGEGTFKAVPTFQCLGDVIGWLCRYN